MTTKQKILDKALILFSQKGYSAVSVKEIAVEVGIKDSSLYKHFISKQEIFDTIVNESCIRSRACLEKFGLSEELNENTLEKFRNLSDDEFVEISSDIFEHCLFDDYFIKFRKLLTIEQYNNPQMSEIFKIWYIDSIMNYLVQIFQMYVSEGVFIDEDVTFLSSEFYAPVFMMYYQLDTNQNSIENLRDHLKKHFLNFKKTYTRRREI